MDKFVHFLWSLEGMGNRVVIVSNINIVCPKFKDKRLSLATALFSEGDLTPKKVKSKLQGNKYTRKDLKYILRTLGQWNREFK